MKLLHHLQVFVAPALLCCSCMLAGCATTASTTQEVRVPVHAPCVGEVPAPPAYEFDKLTPAASDGEKVLALARDWPRGRKYEGQLEAVVAGCK